jgi:hypothetical protein
VGALAAALGHLWRPYAARLLDDMLLTGLTDMLVAALQVLAASLPELLADIQMALLELLSLVLARRWDNCTCRP